MRRLVSVCALMALCVGVPAVAGATLPPGFVEEDFANMSGAISIAWAPDGALWIAQSGPGEGMHVFVRRNGVSTHVLTFPGTPQGERGIHALELDPDYASNGRVWIYRTVLGDPARNRLSHYTNPAAYAGGPDSLDDEVVIWEGPPLLGLIHNGGCFAFKSDGTIFLGTGDDSQGSATAQDPFDHRGKVLHMNPDGTPAANNPFDGVTGDPLVWAMGLRNPFRCNIDPLLDNLFIGDVGNLKWEEIDLGVAGANYGWATVEGPEPSGVSGMVYPMYSYPHDDPSGSAVIVGAVAGPGDFSPAYEGNLFFADWARGTIYRMELENGHHPIGVEVFASNAGFPVELEFGPDGALYYVTRGVHRVRRIEYVGGENRRPVARAVASPENGPAPLDVTLDASPSFDPDGDPLNWSWVTGDGGDLAGEVVNHTYPAGVYEARLTVDDGELTAISPPVRIVSGNRAPQPDMVAPLPDLTYNAGQTIQYSGSAHDDEDGALGCDRLSWEVVFHHDEHTHPFFGPAEGECSGSFQVPTLGEASPDTWFSIHLRARDSGAPLGPAGALVAREVRTVHPNTAHMTFETAPSPDLVLELDTTPFDAPQAVEGVVGFVRRFGAPDQLRDGHTYTWLRWSDGGERDHDVVTPAVDTTYLATFGCNVLATIEGLRVDKTPNNRLRLTWQAVNDPCLSLDPGPAGYRVFAGSSARPAVGDGLFPTDPHFTWIAVTSQTSYTWSPAPGHQFFLVAPVGSDRNRGPVGHYGQ